MDTAITPVTISTERLRLRPFRPDDASRVYDHLKDGTIGQYIGYLPDPYTLDDAQTWIATHPSMLKKHTGITFAITDTTDAQIMGCISLSPISTTHQHAELGYWLGQTFWGQGYATEAAHAILYYGFKYLNLSRIYAHHLPSNAGSMQIMKKLEMQQEAYLRKHINHRGILSDCIIRGILAEEYQPKTAYQIRQVETQ